MTQLTQFYKVVVTTKNKDEQGKNKEVDITKDIPDGLTYEDEDGTIRSCSFVLNEGYAYQEVLSKGMKISLTCGSLESPKNLLNGRIEKIEPDYDDTGEIKLTIQCKGTEGAKLGKTEKDLIYPSKNHPESWATTPLMYSDIIKNLAKQVGFIVQDENINVAHDIEANFKNTIRQSKCTDWRFIQQLAEKISCTAWIESYGSSDYLFLKDNATLTDKLANVTLFYLARVGGDFVETPYSRKNRIKIQKLNMDFGSKKKGVTKKTDPTTGKDTIEAEGVTDNENERYVLDEEKLRALSPERRRELIELFVSGDITWDGDDGTVAAKDYFKLVVKESESSRTGTANNTEIEIAGQQLDKNGVNTVDGTTETTGKVSYKTVINQDKLDKLSPEERAGILGRIVRKELTAEDRELYTVVTTAEKKEEDKTTDTKDTDIAKTTGKKKKTTKRDAGFKIEATIWGTYLFQTRLSYVLEGLGKYSGKYYLYRVKHKFGNNGWLTTLIFTK